jgi:hypothetical protein
MQYDRLTFEFIIYSFKMVTKALKLDWYRFNFLTPKCLHVNLSNYTCLGHWKRDAAKMREATCAGETSGLIIYSVAIFLKFSEFSIFHLLDGKIYSILLEDDIF